MGYTSNLRFSFTIIGKLCRSHWSRNGCYEPWRIGTKGRKSSSNFAWFWCPFCHWYHWRFAQNYRNHQWSLEHGAFTLKILLKDNKFKLYIWCLSQIIRLNSIMLEQRQFKSDSTQSKKLSSFEIAALFTSHLHPVRDRDSILGLWKKDQQRQFQKYFWKIVKDIKVSKCHIGLSLWHFSNVPCSDS